MSGERPINAARVRMYGKPINPNYVNELREPMFFHPAPRYATNTLPAIPEVDEELEARMPSLSKAGDPGK